ncbi:hypothetical protein F896_00983 [Acinetobacter genomosp. 15BJ]|uniref:YagK/YfjJ C-terminal domain-containing protein n=1 Tax=Acinetobacter genomosp. 15BJ TaxID=106651 RepID=R9BAT4_9GAMM|nr:inovirus-type Gp2 protein [Acinetobacter genomosp. 15BJ]EOR09491.1 hypothetical protein F896_00983 [Acinetobacter genomosp. 15BJ]
MCILPTIVNESEVLIRIDQFIQSISIKEFNPQQFSSEFVELSSLFKTIYQVHLKYSISINVFRRMVHAFDEYLSSSSITTIDDLKEFQLRYLTTIALEAYRDIQDELISFKLQENKNKNGLEEYIKQLTQHYSKLLFIRIDLSIELKYQHQIGIEQFYEYLRTFINRMQNQDTCFKDLQGYAWAIEQGGKKGYHCHVLLIYDGHKHQKDFGMAIQVGQCWSEITANKGYVFICNAPEYKAQFQQKGTLGIGMIHRNNPQQVENAVNAAIYLVNPEKENQYLRAKVARMRSFGKGQYEIEKRRSCVASTLSVAKGFRLCTDYYD